MPLTEPRTMRWTKDEYHRLAEMGWFADRRVELLDGAIYEMPVPKMAHVVALAQYAAVYTPSWAADSRNARVRLCADKNLLLQEVMVLREELRIKDARMASLPSTPSAVLPAQRALSHPRSPCRLRLVN